MQVHGPHMTLRPICCTFVTSGRIVHGAHAVDSVIVARIVFAPLDRENKIRDISRKLKAQVVLNFMDTFRMCACACTVRAGVQLNSSAPFSVAWKPDYHSLRYALKFGL